MPKYRPNFDELDDNQTTSTGTASKTSTRKQSGTSRSKPPKQKVEIYDELAQTLELEAGFKTTYKPSRYEAGWLIGAVRPFYDQSLITDVQAQIRGGKEASVYRCEANPVTGSEMLAAKIYRPRMFRQLRNDQMYREGREILNEEGRALKSSDQRLMRALGKKTDFGAQVSHTSWLMHEYNTLDKLYRAGAAVPQPIAVTENAILMTYYGDEQIAAPILHEVNVDADEAEELFVETMRNIDLMLQNNIIHGDLSAYNILYWDGKIALIDFPQVTNPNTNLNARFILSRDISRVCEYFSRKGVRCNPAAILDDLWGRYESHSEEDLAADASKWSEAMEEEEDD